MNYLAHLIRSKGLGQLGQRAQTIAQRYGVTTVKMVQAFEQLVSTLEQNACRATFPTTAVALARDPAPIRQLSELGMEIAVHGWTHVDLEKYSEEQQREHLSRALDVFARHDISAVGFRSPYLRCNGTIRDVVEATGFQYLSNQPILWDVVGELDQLGDRAQSYQQAVDFYAPWPSSTNSSLPFTRGRLVEIPVSLPDDEMLIERLGATSDQVAQAWTGILRRTHGRGELFTLQLHPERAVLCIPALKQLLSEARSYDPPVWIARLNEIAEWWQQRRALGVDVTQQSQDRYDVAIRGPAEASVLVRSARVLGESRAWEPGYQIVSAHRFSVQCGSRPCVGVSARTSQSLIDFLEQQGYLVETGERCAGYSIYFDRPDFDGRGKNLVEGIEAAGASLIRINRWPGGARSAMAITGDIDALTLWDYGLRLVGH